MSSLKNIKSKATMDTEVRTVPSSDDSSNNFLKRKDPCLFKEKSEKDGLSSVVKSRSTSWSMYFSIYTCLQFFNKYLISKTDLFRPGDITHSQPSMESTIRTSGTDGAQIFSNKCNDSLKHETSDSVFHPETKVNNRCLIKSKFNQG